MKEKKKDYGEFPPDDGSIETLSGAASTSDCTGLIPTGNGGSTRTLDNYNNVVSFSAADKQEDIRKSKARKESR